MWRNNRRKKIVCFLTSVFIRCEVVRSYSAQRRINMKIEEISFIYRNHTCERIIFNLPFCFYLPRVFVSSSKSEETLAYSASPVLSISILIYIPNRTAHARPTQILIAYNILQFVIFLPTSGAHKSFFRVLQGTHVPGYE